jgi:hypothetical protein
MYGWVGESLLATLAEVAGPAWTREHAEASTEAYGAIAALMKRGGRRRDEEDRLSPPSSTRYRSRAPATWRSEVGRRETSPSSLVRYPNS